MHCQNADWAILFLLHKFNITAGDDLVSTDFGKYVKYKQPETRGGKSFLSAKSWKTTHDLWRGISRTYFRLDHLKHYECPKSRIEKEDEKDKTFELNHYDENGQPRYGWGVYVQRPSCYIQHKEAVQDVPNYLESLYKEENNNDNAHRYMPDLQLLDNVNTIIIFEDSQSGSIEDTAIVARQLQMAEIASLPRL